jgi:hypothetical protein
LKLKVERFAFLPPMVSSDFKTDFILVQLISTASCLAIILSNDGSSGSYTAIYYRDIIYSTHNNQT